MIPSRILRQQQLKWKCNTLLSNKTPTHLLSSLSSLLAPVSAQSNDQSEHYIFAVSKNTPNSVVEAVHKLLSSRSPSTSCIGVLSEPLPAYILPKAYTSPTSSATSDSIYSIALASLTTSNNSTSKIIPFRSTLTGRENVAVGKEIQSKDRRYNDGTVDKTVDTGFEAFLSGKAWNFGQATATSIKTIQGIDQLDGIQPQAVKQLICFTSDRSQPFLAALSKYPLASTIGLHASSTPFHSPTGLPFTLLFTNSTGQLKTSGIGAVGIALVEEENKSARSNVRVEYSGLEIFDRSAEITTAKGNIVLTLSTQNAARLLLKAVQDLNAAIAKRDGTENVKLPNDRGKEKDQEFYAAVFESDPGPNPDLSKSIHVSRIMAGDPSRGAMSFETEEEMKVGSWVTFLHRPSTTHAPSSLFPPFSSASTASTSTDSSSFTFLSVSASLDIPLSDYPPSTINESLLQSNSKSSTDVLVVDGFIAASENGVVLTRSQREGVRSSWVCRTEGAVVRLD